MASMEHNLYNVNYCDLKLIMAIVLNVTERRMEMQVEYCFNLYMIYFYIWQNYIYVYYIF